LTEKKQEILLPLASTIRKSAEMKKGPGHKAVFFSASPEFIATVNQDGYSDYSHLPCLSRIANINSALNYSYL